jgi:hypothetical protein
MDIVKSSAIRGLDYDASTGTIQVHFLSGGSHPFGPFTLAQYDAFKNAPSVGKHFHKAISSKALNKPKK